MVKKIKKPFIMVIRNAKRGSGSWFHEKRHEWQEERFGLLSLTANLHHYLVILCLVTALYFKEFAVQSIILLILNDWLLELDADYYALKKVGLRAWLNRDWV